MVKKFAGQVKVADVQAAFDEVVGRVNYLVDSYNGQAFVKDIDYTVGGTTLAPAGYTLTVGGYKQFLNACEGCVVGGKPFRVDDNHLKMSTGMLVSRDGIFKLPDSVLTIPTDKKYRTVYFNTVTQDYEWIPTGHSVIVKKYVNVGSPLVKDETNDYYYSDYNLGYGYNSLTGSTNFAFWYDLDNTNKTVDLDMSKYITLSCDIMTAGNYVEMDFSHYSTDDEYNIQNGQLQFWFGNLSSNGKTFKPAHLISTQYVGESNQLGCSMSLQLGSIYESSGKAIVSTYSTRSFSNTLYGVPKLKSIRYYFYNNAVQARYVTEDNTEVPIGTINLNDDLRNLNVNCIIFNNNGVEYGPSNPSVTTTKDYNYRIKDHYKVCSSEGSVISTLNTDGSSFAYYDVVIEPAEDISYRICDINTECSSNYIGTVHNVLSEKISGKLNIYSQDRDYTTTKNYIRVQRSSGTSCYNALDTSKAAKFVSALTADVSSDYSGGNDISLFGTKVCHVGYQGRGRGEYYFPMTFLYVPKGVSNPYTYYDSWRDTTNPNASCQKVLNVIIDKNIEDKSG